MIGLIIILAMALGIGGTVVAADDARPGDTLFGIDRAVENVRVSLASEENKNELRVRFAEERIKEVSELEEESKIVNGPTESLTVEQEAEVTAGIESALDLLTDLDEVGEIADARLEGLAAELSAFLDNLPDDARVQVSNDRLRIKFDQGPEKIEIKDQGKNKTKIEVRTGEGRLRVEVKNGLIEIKTKMEKGENSDSSEDERSEIEAEAEILSDKTIVEVEIGDEKTTFATSANTKEGIVAAIIAKFPNLSADQIGAVLKIETEDDEDPDDDSDDDNDKDEDEDSDSDDNNDDDSDDSKDDDD
ncbi:MAG: hypothetical protein G01um101424_259 [Parcubacteria group bacterium Gr01-1014_24]|nr:MAG: hypothetical protein G01um101424_259 [Parcubacteria group bacterium Gr01-1014_24]